MNITDKLERLHGNLMQKDGFNIPLEQFASDMQNEDKLKKLHANLAKKDGFTVPYEQFKVDMLGDVGITDHQPTTNRPPKEKQHVDAYSSATNQNRLRHEQDSIMKFKNNPRSVMGMDINEAKTAIEDSIPDRESSSGFSGFGEELGKRAHRSAVELNKMLTNAPNGILRALNVPFDYLYEAIGLPKTDPQAFNKLTGLDKVSDNLESQKEILTKQIAKLNPKHEQGIVESAQKGDWVTFTRNLAGGVADSFAPSLAMMVSGGAMGTTGMITSGASVFGAGKLDELDKNAPDMPEGVKVLSAYANGALEGIFETYLGSGAVGNSLKKIIAKEGKETGEKIVAQGLREGISNILSKYPALAPFGEGFEEWGTQVSQNYVDKISGYKPDINVFDGALDAMLIGVASGGAHSVPMYAAKGITELTSNNKKARNPEDIVPELSPREQAEQNLRSSLNSVVNKDGRIHTAKDVEGNDLFILDQTNDGMLVVADREGKRDIVDNNALSDFNIQDIEEIAQGEMVNYDIRQAAQKQAETIGQTFTIEGEQYVINDILPDGTMFTENTKTGDAMQVRPDQMEQITLDKDLPQQEEQTQEDNQIRPEHKFSIGKNEYTAIQEDDGSYKILFNEKLNPDKAIKEISETLPDGEQSRVEVIKEAEEVLPDTPWGKPTINEVVKGVRIKPQVDPQLKAEVEQDSKPSYSYEGEEIDKDVAKELIEDAESIDDLQGLQYSNDASLDKLVEKKFPEIKPSYQIGGKDVTIAKAKAKIIKAKTVDELHELIIKNDPKTENYFDDKLKKLTESASQDTELEGVKILEQQESLQKNKSNESIDTNDQQGVSQNEDDLQGSGNEGKTGEQEKLADADPGANVLETGRSDVQPELNVNSDEKPIEQDEPVSQPVQEGENTQKETEGERSREGLEEDVKTKSSQVSTPDDISSLNEAESKWLNVRIQDESEPLDQREYWKDDLIDLKNNPKKYWDTYDLRDDFKETNPTRYEEIKKMQEYYSDNAQKEKLEIEKDGLILYDLEGDNGLAVADTYKRTDQFRKKYGVKRLSEFKEGDFIYDIFFGKKYIKQKGNNSLGELKPIGSKNTQSANLSDPRYLPFTPTENELIEQAENEAATSPNNDLPEPTEGQKKAGNHKKGHARVAGLNVTIENPVGSVRKGISPEGKPWETEMKNTYGYFKRTKGKDGDQIDFFLGDNPRSNKVYVVDQIEPETGEFDEHKVMLGFNTAQEAQEAYMSNYEEGWKGLGAMTAISKKEFNKWLNTEKKNKRRKRKPVSELVKIKPIPERPMEEGAILHDWIADYSDDANEIFKAHVSELESAPYSQLLPWQQYVISQNITKESFERFSDKNNITGTLAKSWFKKDGLGIDQLHQSISEDYNEVDIQEIIDFILKFPGKNVRKTTDLVNPLVNRYREVTGMSIKNHKFVEQAENKLDFYSWAEGKGIDTEFKDYHELLETLEENKDGLTEEKYSEFRDFLITQREAAEQGRFLQESETDEQSSPGEEQEINPNQEEIDKANDELQALKVKLKNKVSESNSRNGLFGDVATNQPDLFGSQEFDVNNAKKILDGIKSEISKKEQEIENLKSSGETALKENKGQTEIQLQGNNNDTFLQHNSKNNVNLVKENQQKTSSDGNDNREIRENSDGASSGNKPNISESGIQGEPESTETSNLTESGDSNQPIPEVQGGNRNVRHRDQRDSEQLPGTSGGLDGGQRESSTNARGGTNDLSPRQNLRNQNNNVIQRGERLAPRGDKAKVSANLKAIKIAKSLEKTGKQASKSQMEALKKYTGWGGLSSVFNYGHENYYDVSELLTDEEYKAARASTKTAFFTPPEIISDTWDMIEKLGFKGGNILEPSAGIGHFFGLMPQHLAQVSNLKGIEIDNISGSIMKALYPDANIEIDGYENIKLPNNSIDLVVTNVPFGAFKLYDPNEKQLSKKFDIHDFFIAKSVRKLKPGGIGVFITTTSTMDKSNELRTWLTNEGNADVIDAVRLNDKTFKSEAGTEASSDIIIIQKRTEQGKSPYAKNILDVAITRQKNYTAQEKDKKHSWRTIEVEKTATMKINKFFADNPDKMAGEMKFGMEGGNTLRPTEQRLASVKDIDQQEVLNNFKNQLPSDIYNLEKGSIDFSKPTTDFKEGGLTIIEGQPAIVRNGAIVELDWNNNKVAGKPKAEVVRDYV